MGRTSAQTPCRLAARSCYGTGAIETQQSVGQPTTAAGASRRMFTVLATVADCLVRSVALPACLRSLVERELGVAGDHGASNHCSLQ